MTTRERVNTTCPDCSRAREGLPLRRNFGWAFVGNIAYQGCQWLNFVIMAKLLDVAEVGRFAFALAICTPITMFSALNLRAVQVTDSRGEHRFGHYLALQLCNSTIAMIVIGVIATLTGGTKTGYLIIAVGGGQAIMLLRDVYLAYAQKLQRMDCVALSKGIIGIASLIGLASVVWSTRNVILGVLAMQCVRLLVFLLWDIPATLRLARAHEHTTCARDFMPVWQPKRVFSLVWIAAPLGCSAVIASLEINAPRYLIEYWYSKSDLGYFVAIVSLVLAGATITSAAGQAALPRLCTYWEDSHKHFVRLLVRLIGLGFVLGLFGMLIVLVAGEWILSVVYAPEYAQHKALFLWSMCYGVLSFSFNFLAYGILSMRRFTLLAFMNAISLGVVLATGAVLVPHYGLIGAVWCLMAGKLCQGLIAGGVVVRELRRSKRAIDSETPQILQI